MPAVQKQAGAGSAGFTLPWDRRTDFKSYPALSHVLANGGQGSGNFNHAGRPGEKKQFKENQDKVKAIFETHPDVTSDKLWGPKLGHQRIEFNFSGRNKSELRVPNSLRHLLDVPLKKKLTNSGGHDPNLEYCESCNKPTGKGVKGPIDGPDFCHCEKPLKNGGPGSGRYPAGSHPSNGDSGNQEQDRLAREYQGLVSHAHKLAGEADELSKGADKENTYKAHLEAMNKAAMASSQFRQAAGHMQSFHSSGLSGIPYRDAFYGHNESQQKYSDLADKHQEAINQINRNESLAKHGKSYYDSEHPEDYDSRPAYLSKFEPDAKPGPARRATIRVFDEPKAGRSELDSFYSELKRAKNSRIQNGAQGSGNFGHGGRPGMVGGSGPGGLAEGVRRKGVEMAAAKARKEEFYQKFLGKFKSDNQREPTLVEEKKMRKVAEWREWEEWQKRLNAVNQHPVIPAPAAQVVPAPAPRISTEETPPAPDPLRAEHQPLPPINKTTDPATLHYKPSSFGLIRDEELRTRSITKREEGFAVDSEGRKIWAKPGNEDTIIVDPDDRIKMMNDGNCVLTHNHPVTGGPFSSADVLFAIKTNLKEIRAVGKDFTYSMQRPAGGWPKMSCYNYPMVSAVAYGWQLHFKENMKLHNEAGASSNWLNTEKRNDFWQNFAAKNGIVYERTRTNP